MSKYIIMAAGQCKTIEASSLPEALAAAKDMFNADDWDACPIWTGEVRVDTYFKCDGKKYRMYVAKETI